MHITFVQWGIVCKWSDNIGNRLLNDYFNDDAYMREKVCSSKEFLRVKRADV